jgi:hypothetical protein
MTLRLYQYVSISYYKSATYFNDCMHWNAFVCVLLHFSHIFKNCCIIFNIFPDSNSSVMDHWWLLQFSNMSEWHHIKCNTFISIFLHFCYMLKSTTLFTLYSYIPMFQQRVIFSTFLGVYHNSPSCFNKITSLATCIISYKIKKTQETA